jgi:hypothetical protein
MFAVIVAPLLVKFTAVCAPAATAVLGVTEIEPPSVPPSTTPRVKPVSAAAAPEVLAPAVGAALNPVMWSAAALAPRPICSMLPPTAVTV